MGCDVASCAVIIWVFFAESLFERDAGKTAFIVLLCFDAPCQSSQGIIYLLLRFLAAQCVDLLWSQGGWLWLLWVQVQHLSPLHPIRLAFSFPEPGILLLSFGWCVSFPQRFLWALLQQSCQIKIIWGKNLLFMWSLSLKDIKLETVFTLLVLFNQGIDTEQPFAFNQVYNMCEDFPARDWLAV